MLYRNSKQVCLSFKKSDPVRCKSPAIKKTITTVVSEISPANVSVAKVVSSDNREAIGQSQDIVLSNRYEWLATLPDSTSDVHHNPMLEHSLGRKDLQRSVSSHDRKFTLEENTNRFPVTGNTNPVEGGLVTSMVQETCDDKQSLKVDVMDYAQALDATGFVGDCSQLDHLDATDLLPVWCADFEKCKQQIGLKFRCVPLTPIITYLGLYVKW